jgi:hypothetical protein
VISIHCSASAEVWSVAGAAHAWLTTTSMAPKTDSHRTADFRPFTDTAYAVLAIGVAPVVASRGKVSLTPGVLRRGSILGIAELCCR